jgi:hypothetical protein
MMRLLRLRHFCKLCQFRILLLDFVLVISLFGEQMFVPFAIADSSFAPSKRWCVGFAMLHGGVRSAGKGTST